MEGLAQRFYVKGTLGSPNVLKVLMGGVSKKEVGRNGLGEGCAHISVCGMENGKTGLREMVGAEK